MTRVMAVTTMFPKAILKVMKFVQFARFARIGFFAILLVSLVFAPDSTSLTTTLCTIYKLLQSIIPIMAFTLMVLAGVAYGIGNFFGAELRAKANSWAMSCITGAIISIIIIIFSDILITNLLGADYTGSKLCP
jgi:hypothetical protein